MASKHVKFVEEMYSKNVKKQEEKEKLKMAKVGMKRTGKQLTNPQPFELATSKRAKLFDNEENNSSGEYQPLWKQVNQAFQLREENGDKDFEEYMMGATTPNLKRQPTRPESPKLTTKDRKSLKVKFDALIGVSDEPKPFKAR